MMACDIIYDSANGVACYYCNTTDHAFGPVITKFDSAQRDMDPGEALHAFRMHIGVDPRTVEDESLDRALHEWLTAD